MKDRLKYIYIYVYTNHFKAHKYTTYIKQFKDSLIP